MSRFSPALRRLLTRLHRWLALIFALPLAVIILTGLVLSIEPLLHASGATSGRIDAEALATLIERHDPESRARAIALRPYDGTLEIAGTRQGPPLVLDLETGAPRAHGPLARTLLAARHLHESLIGPLQPLVAASSVVLLILVALGLALGAPRRPRTLSGWHRVTGWAGLPLLVLAPLTGLFISFGVMFGGGGQAPMALGRQAQPMSMAAMVRVAAQDGRDLSGLVWIRRMGPRAMMRHTDGSSFLGWFITETGTVPVPRAWPVAIHEGLWRVPLLFVVNLAICLLSGGLLVTGVTLWLRRRLRRRSA